MLTVSEKERFSAARHTRELCGAGAADHDLTPDDLRAIVAQALATVERGARVLAIIPDKTRDDNTDILFPFAAEILADKSAAKFDALVAQGTHAPMSVDEKRAKIGLTENANLPLFGEVFDHRWDDARELVTIGELAAVRVSKLTGGLIERDVPLTINRLLACGRYDTVLIFGGVVPHEVAGFAGGAKYFFPGVAGAELTHATHWLGALAGVENIIGRVETPTRHLIEAAADFLPQHIINFSTVVTRTDTERLRTHALFAGDFRLAMRAAAAVSSQVHIKYTRRKYRRVVALLDEHYDEMWVGGKASYKLGSVIEAGGELIIYAPQLKHFSQTHGALIERYGYAPLETIQTLLAEDSELQNNLCVAAHLAHVTYASRKNADGSIAPRYKITLASGIDDAACRRVKLGWLDWREFNLAEYAADVDILIVERAGRDLYLIE